MRIALHLGVHFAGTPRLLASLRANKEALELRGTQVPHVHTYRKPVLDLLADLDGLPPIGPEQDRLLASITEGTPRQLVLADPDWASPLGAAFADGRLYARIAAHAPRVIELFEGQDLHLSLAIRNPAFFVNEALVKDKHVGAVHQFLRWSNPDNLSWIPVIDALRKAVPDAPLTVWCEEDTPLIWPRILRTVGGLREDDKLRTSFSALRNLMRPEGLNRLHAYVRTYPPADDAQTEQVILAFLDKYGIESAMKAPSVVPDWTAQTIRTISDHYERDIDLLAARDDIDMILPLPLTDAPAPAGDI